MVDVSRIVNKKTTFDVVFYHNDMDGLACAAIHYYNKGNEQTIYQPVDYSYNDDMIYNTIWSILENHVKINEICIFDFCVSDKTLEYLIDNFNVTLIDHHKTTIDQLKRFGIEITYGYIRDEKLKGYVCIKESACFHSFKYYSYVCDSNMDSLVKYINDRDVFRFEYSPYTEYYHEYFDFKFGKNIHDEDIVKRFSNELYVGNFDSDKSILKKGKLLYLYKMNLVREIANAKFKEYDSSGNLCYIVSCPNHSLISDVGRYIIENNDDKEVKYIFFYRYGNNGSICYASLRSVDKNFDVSEMAKEHGGGGHKNAAGYVKQF